MASGSLTLLEAAKSGGEMKKSGVIETIIQESPEIEMLPWMTISGNAYKHTAEDTVASVAFRAINSTYGRSFGTDTEHYWGVAILGGEVFIDNFLLKVTSDQASAKAKQWIKISKANAMRFGYEFYNGDGTGNGFKGMKNLIAEGFGQTFANSVTGATVSLDKLDEAADLFVNQGGPEALLANRTFRRQVTKAARTSVTGVSLIDVGSDVFGRQVTTWNDVPIRIVGNTLDGSGNVVPALPFTEDPGDAVLDTCSAYFVKFGDDDITGLLGAGGSFEVKDFGEQEAAPGHLGRIEWYPGIAIFNQYSVVRFTGTTAV